MARNVIKNRIKPKIKIYMKSLILIVICALAAPALYAQNYYAGAGATVNSIDKINSKFIDHTGYYATVKMDNKLSDKVGYSGYGQFTHRSNESLKMNSLDAGFTFNPNLTKKLSLNLGFEIAYILSLKAKATESPEHERGQLSGIAGLSYEMGRLQIVGRYLFPSEKLFTNSAQLGVNYRLNKN